MAGQFSKHKTTQNILLHIEIWRNFAKFQNLRICVPEKYSKQKPVNALLVSLLIVNEPYKLVHGHGQ